MFVFLVCGVQFKFTGAARIRRNAALLMLPGRKKNCVDVFGDLLMKYNLELELFDIVWLLPV